MLSFSPPCTELALYKLKLKQEGARRPSLTVQASSQVGLSYLPLQYLPDIFCMCYFLCNGNIRRKVAVFIQKKQVWCFYRDVIESETDTKAVSE